MSQTEIFKIIDDDYFISELANESEIFEQKDTKIVQFFYHISQNDVESSSEEIFSSEESTNNESISGGSRKDIVDVIINILQILTLK